MLKLYFVRHGETLSNTWHTLQGFSDTPLTKNGILQGQCLGKGLRDIPFLKIYSSTSERAYDTACYARADRDIDIIMNKGLKEMNFGTYETKSNTFAGCTTYQERLCYEWDRYGGENLTMLSTRIAMTIKKIIEENKEKDGNILCVTHGISMLSALRFVDEDVFQQCLKEEIRFGNCCVSVISWDHGIYKIEEINNMKYVLKGGYTTYEENHK